MDMEFKDPEEIYDFCGGLYHRIKDHYFDKDAKFELDKVEQFRLVRVLEEWPHTEVDKK